MDRPLWQIFLSMILAAYGLIRLGTGAILLANDDATGLLWSHGLQALGGMLAAVGMWAGGRARTWALAAFAAALAAAVAVETIQGFKPAVAAVAQIGAVLLGIGVLAHLIKAADATDAEAS